MNRHDLSACGVLLIVALAWAAPLAARLQTHMPGTTLDTDVATMVWNVGWVQRAIETDAALLRSEAVLLPFGADLRAHTYGAFPAMLVWPIAAASGALTAFNVMLIGTLILNGWLAYFLCREAGAGSAASLVAGSALMLGGPALDQLHVGRPIFASLWITCAALVAARRLLARPGVVWTVTLGGILIAALFTDLQMLLFTGIWLAWLAAWTLVSERGIDRRRLTAAIAAAAIVAVPLLVIVYPAFTVGGAPLPMPDAIEAARYSYRWWDYFTPSVMPRAIGGYELAAAAVGGLVLMRRDARIRIWLWGAVCCFVLALGPTLKFTGMPLPFAALAWFPPLDQFRMPSRLTIPAIVGLAVVMALVLDRLFAGMTSRRVAWVVAALIALRVTLAVVQHPLQTQSYPVYETYQRLAEAGDPGALIEVPFGVRSGIDRVGPGDTLQYYQHVHGRPIMNGMVARLPGEVFAFYRRHPAVLALAGVPAHAPDADVATDLGNVIDLAGARYVLVHHDLMTPEHAALVDRLLRAHPRLEHWVTEGSLVVYRVVPQVPS